MNWLKEVIEWLETQPSHAFQYGPSPKEYNKVKVRAIKILQILYINNVPRPHIIKDLPIKFIWETKSSCSYIEIYGDKYYVAYKDEMGGIRKEESDINILLKHVRAVYEKDNSA